MVKEWVLDVSKMLPDVKLGLFEYLILAIGIWLALLSFLTLRTIRHYRQIMRGATGLNLGQVLEGIVKKLDLNEQTIQQIWSEVAKIKIANQKNFQKYALVRFNPFEDTGGDQSFVLALLDGQNNGIVISSLHSRGGTRVYTKQVANGQATTHQFSKEEKEVVDQACLPAGRTALRV